MNGDELTRGCRFSTERLDIVDWHSASLPEGTLADTVVTLLTAATTRSLPLSWRGDYDAARAAAWIRERDVESAVSMVTERETRRPVGLVIASETPSGDSNRVEIRLGYLLAESYWGRGLGSELVAGFVEWCRSIPRIRSVAGGVALDNLASARVLSKNGFIPVGSVVDGEQLYSLDLATLAD